MHVIPAVKAYTGVLNWTRCHRQAMLFQFRICDNLLFVRVSYSEKELLQSFHFEGSMLSNGLDKLCCCTPPARHSSNLETIHMGSTFHEGVISKQMLDKGLAAKYCFGHDMHFTSPRMAFASNCTA